MKLTILAALTLTLTAHAGPEMWFQHGLIMPETIATLRAELDLTTEQVNQMLEIVSEARTAAEPLELAVKETQKAFNESLRKRETSADVASTALARLLEAEAPVKQLQLRTLIQLRDCMTAEQQKKALQLAPGKLAKKTDLEPHVREKINKLKTAVESLEIKATQEMTRRGMQIEDLIREGQWKQAEADLDKLILESGVNEPESHEAIDFSLEDPGDTDLAVLRERLAEIESKAESVISIPLIRQFIQAKKALEKAKEAQDAELVGRILTWGEKKLANQ